jgi:hypothetical protein
MISRRNLLLYCGTAMAAFTVRGRAATVARAETAQQALHDSAVIYITPLKKDGAESSCHAEVWFAFDNSNIYVVTSSKAWRARAISLGLTQARMWVGEFGVWTKAKSAYRKAPEILAAGERVDDASTQTRVLESFGKKYHAEWLVWGPRFRNGLKDGSRVMLRYTPSTA